VVPSDDTADSSTFENVLVAVDLSPASRALIDTSMELLGGDVRRVTAIHAIDSLEPAGALRTRARWLVPEYRGYRLGEARRRLKSVLPQTVGTDIKPEVRVAAGTAAETIGAHAADVNANLIMMGRSKRFMHLGSTAVRILRNTNRALLVVPPAAAAQAADAEQEIPKHAA
jgi:nucleotide-binding universal stress UspA family protein